MKKVSFHIVKNIFESRKDKSSLAVWISNNTQNFYFFIICNTTIQGINNTYLHKDLYKNVHNSLIHDN